MRIVQKPSDRLEWLKWRQGGIGGSDVASILGTEKFGKPIDVYLSKVGPVQDNNMNHAQRLGIMLEPMVVKYFHEETGLTVEPPEGMFLHDTIDHFYANVDGIVTENGKKGILECKNNGEFRRVEWESDTGPLSYFYQLQWYMFVTGYEFGYLAAFVGGNDFVCKRIEKNHDVIDMLVTAASEFWKNHVIPRVPPPPDGSKDYSEFISALYPNSVVRSVDLSSSRDLYDELSRVREDIKVKSSIEETLKQRIQVLMKDSDVALFGDGDKVTWRSQKAVRFDSKAFEADHPDLASKYKKESSFRVFRMSL